MWGNKTRQAEDYNRLGDEKFNSRQYEEAITYYTKAIKRNPKYALAYYTRGSAKSKLEQYEAAIADHTKAIELRS